MMIHRIATPFFILAGFLAITQIQAGQGVFELPNQNEH
jgi:hypothetical protein